MTSTKPLVGSGSEADQSSRHLDGVLGRVEDSVDPFRPAPGPGLGPGPGPGPNSPFFTSPLKFRFIPVISGGPIALPAPVPIPPEDIGAVKAGFPPSHLLPVPPVLAGAGAGAPTPFPSPSPRAPAPALTLTLPFPKLAVNASIFFSNSATRLSVFFCLLRVGAVTTHSLPVLTHRLHVPRGSCVSGSQRTFRLRHASQARGGRGASCSWSWSFSGLLLLLLLLLLTAAFVFVGVVVVVVSVPGSEAGPGPGDDETGRFAVVWEGV